MSEEAGIKEPKFFCSDRWYSHQSHPRAWNEYLALFKNSPDSASYLGDATPRYLQSKIAVPEILKSCHRPCLIVMLRNPVDLVSSQHNQKIKVGYELNDLERAWRLQSERLKGKALPPQIKEGMFFNYADHAMLGEQMQRLLQHADHSQIHVIFFEDFKMNPGACYRSLLEWLSLPDDGRTNFAAKNSSMSFRSKRLNSAWQMARRIKQRLGIPGFGLGQVMSRVNAKSGHEPMRPEFRRELQDYFRDDIKLLSELTGRDLSHWYQYN